MRIQHFVRPVPTPQARGQETPVEHARRMEQRMLALMASGLSSRVFQAAVDLHDKAGEPLEIEYGEYLIRLEVLPK